MTHTIASPLPTRAISVHAPWAWALMYGKDIENRTHKTPGYKFPQTVLGRVWVHASKWPKPGPVKPGSAPWEALVTESSSMARTLAASRGLGDLPQLAQQTNLALNYPSLSFATIDSLRGHIVGSIEVTGYRTPDDPPSSPWYVSGSLAIMVRDPRPLAKPVPAKGALGWWTPPPDVMAQLKEAA